MSVIGTILVALMLIGAAFGFFVVPKFIKDGEKVDRYGGGTRTVDNSGTRNIAKGISGGVFALAMIFLLMMVITIVDDGKVGVTRAFGEYGEETLQPGINFILPWETVSQVDTRVKSYTFSNNAEESISGPISAQARGGGNLQIEQTVQLQVDKETADDLLREVGSDWFNTVVLPPIRSCTRDSSVHLTLEQAYTSGRGEISTNTMKCVSESVNPYGITLLDVLIRDVDPGQAVKTAIDEKQQAEQNLQKAAIQTRVVEEEARQESIRSYGLSNAEQIVACGGTETTKEVDGKTLTIIVPNEECEQQFSQEYLQWLYINELSKIQGAVILPPEFDGNMFIQTPQPQAQPQG